MDSIASAFCKTFALSALFALLTSATLFFFKPRQWIKPRQQTRWNSHIRCSLCVCNS